MRTSDYIFESTQIKKETGRFSTYLQEKQFARNTIKPYINYTGYFLNWLEQSRIKPEQAGYNNILQFIEYCRDYGKGNRLINRILSAIRHYYNFLGQNQIITNPAAGVYIKGAYRTVPNNLIGFEQLEALYKNFKAIDNRTKRNKVILGLIIYQYPKVDEIKNLQTTDLYLQEGKIHIPGTRKSSPRMLELKPFQMMNLQEYVHEIRPLFIKEQTNQLFISVHGNKNIKNSIFHMFNAIKKINQDIKSPTQIRLSVISHLQRSVPLRQLQYMAGHKHISSTERYKKNDTEELYKQLELFHPLN